MAKRGHHVLGATPRELTNGGVTSRYDLSVLDASQWAQAPALAEWPLRSHFCARIADLLSNVEV